MKRKFILPLTIIVLLLAVAIIYFGIIRQDNFYGNITISCSDTAEFTYSSNTAILIKVKQKCGDSIRVETKTPRGNWEPLTTTQSRTLGPTVEVVNFDTNTVALVGLSRGDKIRFICFNGEFDSCKLELLDIARERTFMRAGGDSIACGVKTSTRVFNFSRSNSMVLRINWSSVCGTSNGVRFTPSKPKLYEKDNNQTGTVEVGGPLIRLTGSSATLDAYIFSGSPRGGKELLIECPGNLRGCEYNISVKGGDR